MKKLFIISSVLLGVVLLFLGIYNFAFKKSVPVASQTVVADKKTETPVVEKKIDKISNISSRKVMGVMIDKKTDDITYYDAQDGTTWKSDFMGKNEMQVSAVKLVGLKSVAWSLGGNKVLTSIEKNGQVPFYEYDYLSKKGTPLKNGLDSASWDNTGGKIFYKYYDAVSKKRTLNVADPDGSGWQKIADIAARNLNIAPVPLSSLVSFWNSPDAKEESKLQVVGLTGGEAKTVFSGDFGGDYLWSPDGKKALVSSLHNANGKMVSLGLISIDGQYQDLNIPTLASKCVWSADNKTVYYALAGGIPDNAIMPNDYLKNNFTTKDTFWKMNIETGEKSRIVDTAEIKSAYDSSNMMLSATEDAVYFVNKVDQRLYRIQL